jgi:hypothetical protein
MGEFSQNVGNIVAILAWVAVILIVFFLLCREIICWYFKINQIVGLLSVIKASHEMVSPETHIRCPDCKGLILKEAKKCMHCSCTLVPQ